MKKGIRIIAQCYEIGTGKTLEESVLRDDPLSKAETCMNLVIFMLSKLILYKKFKILK